MLRCWTYLEPAVTPATTGDIIVVATEYPRYISLKGYAVDGRLRDSSDQEIETGGPIYTHMVSSVVVLG